MAGNNYHTISAEYQTHTEGALCVRIDDADYWFPHTTIQLQDPLIDFERGDDITLDVQAWILEKNGLDYLIEG